MKQPTFVFSSASWHEVYDKLSTASIKQVITKNLTLANYTTTVNKIVFIYIATRPNNIRHTEVKKYHPRKKEIHTYLKLDYEKVKVSSKTTVVQMMAQLFLDSILLYPEMKVKDFDYQRFYQDVQALFQEQDWLGKSQVVAQ